MVAPHRVRPSPLLTGALLLVLPFIAASCGDTVEPVPRNGEFSHVDPAGDVPDMARPPVKHDVRRVSGFVESDTLVLTLEFDGVVEPGAAGLDHQIMGLIYFDTDENAATGGISLNGWSYYFGGLGAEYAIDVQTMYLHPMVPEGLPGTLIRTEWPGKSVRLYIPLSLLGPDDGRMNMAGIVSPPVLALDRFPNDQYLELRWSVAE